MALLCLVSVRKQRAFVQKSGGYGLVVVSTQLQEHINKIFKNIGMYHNNNIGPWLENAGKYFERKIIGGLEHGFFDLFKIVSATHEYSVYLSDKEVESYYKKLPSNVRNKVDMIENCGNKVSSVMQRMMSQNKNVKKDVEFRNEQNKQDFEKEMDEAKSAESKPSSSDSSRSKQKRNEADMETGDKAIEAMLPVRDNVVSSTVNVGKRVTWPKEKKSNKKSKNKNKNNNNNSNKNDVANIYDF